MIFTILGMFLAFLGISLVFFKIQEYNKNQTYTFNVFKLTLDLSTGFCYFIIGLLVAFKIISGGYLVFIVLLSTILNGIVNYRIKMEEN